MEHESDHHGISKDEGQGRWKRDGSKFPKPLSSHMFTEGQGGDASRSYYQGKRLEPKMGLAKQGNCNSSSQPHGEDAETGYEDGILSLTFEGLEERFLDDIRRLTEEQTDAEDAENARHRERIDAINAQYQEELAALQTQQASHRGKFLQREFLSRQQQYKQAAIDYHPDSDMGPNDPHNCGAVSVPAGERCGAYNSDYYDSYKERARFLGGKRDHGLEPRGRYAENWVYNTGRC